MHDEGTGGNTDGGYGIFPLFPLMNCNFVSCPVGLSARQALRARGTDGVSLPSHVQFVKSQNLTVTYSSRCSWVLYIYFCQRHQA